MMHVSEPAVQEKTGISLEMRNYIAQVIGEIKLDAYAEFLNPAEMEKMRRHQRTRGHEWHPLIRAVGQQMQNDPAGTAAESIALARQWMELFNDMIGSNPETIARFRRAIETEPLLRVGRGMRDDMLAWLRGIAKSA
jgi:MerR family transcriptional regulator, thiopeptide resistance regulator